MSTPIFAGRWRQAASAAALALVLVGPALPVMAQESAADIRMRKMEAEIRALQRKVFPGDDKFFAPEITPGTTPATAAGATAAPAAGSAVTDLIRRMDALEAQIASLTGQVEMNSNRIAQLEARAGIAAPAATTPAVATTAPAAAPTAAPTPAPTPASQSNIDAMTGGASAKPTVAPATTPAAAPAVTKPAVATPAKPSATTPSAKRLQAVQAIVKPQTADAGDDEYSYGFRLWEAKFYPEAEQQLMLFLNKYPRHERVSWGRNLLGRAYLDDGNPGEAAKWFLQNYQADKRGARAADSLLYLAASMKQMKDTKRACIALAEFAETYAAEAAGRLKGQYDSTRNGLACS